MWSRVPARFTRSAPNLVGPAKAVYAPKSNYVKTRSALSGTLLSSQVSVPPPSQYLGSAGRNDLHRPAFAQLTLAVHKSVPLGWENSNLEFSMEAFNVLNSTNFQYPDTAVTHGASFGTCTAANASLISGENCIDHEPLRCCLYRRAIHRYSVVFRGANSQQ